MRVGGVASIRRHVQRRANEILRAPVHSPPGARVGYNTSILPKRGRSDDSRARLCGRPGSAAREGLGSES